VDSQDAFERFAPSVLRIYRRDKEAFWAAVMAPFLSRNGLLSMWRHRRVGLQLLRAFRGLDDCAQQTLRAYSAPLGVDVTQWQSNRFQYFKDAYPIFTFLAIWLDEQSLDDVLAQFPNVLRAAVFGVAGYGILDVNVDSKTPSPVEILTAQALISEYETTILRVFGATRVNLDILHRMRTLFLQAEIKEKQCRGVSSPYTLDHPEMCGAKGAHTVTPFMLSLDRLQRAGQTDAYWGVFLDFGAVIQIIDDWQDLADDLALGHYSYVTLGAAGLSDGTDPQVMAVRLRNDSARVRQTYAVCKTLIQKSYATLNELNDPFLTRLVDVTDQRLEAYFRKDLKLT
jgi:hypothetical protein